jgi:DnaD/phage-associated family protein
MDLILRLSWGCGKKTAIIPRQKDFELVGIRENKIKSELEWLVNAKVVIWNKKNNEYCFNKNYDEWRVSIVPGYSRKRFEEILHVNIETSQNGNQLPKTGTSQNGKLPEKGTFEDEENIKLPEKGTFEDEENIKLPEKGRENFPKREELVAANPTETCIREVPKESIKESNISSSSSSSNAREGEVFKFFHNNICSTPGAFQYDEINHYLNDGLNPELLIEAMKDSVGAKYSKWNLLQKILKECMENNIFTVEQYNARKLEREKAKSRDKPNTRRGSDGTIKANSRASPGFKEL